MVSVVFICSFCTFDFPKLAFCPVKYVFFSLTLNLRWPQISARTGWQLIHFQLCASSFGSFLHLLTVLLLYSPQPVMSLRVQLGKSNARTRSLDSHQDLQVPNIHAQPISPPLISLGKRLSGREGEGNVGFSSALFWPSHEFSFMISLE